MAKWNRRNNCYSYAVDYSNRWLLINNSYDEAIEEILHRNSNLRLVSKQDLVLGKEYVAFRYGRNDFHFMKRGKNGHWRHKMGNQPVEAISTKVVFDKVWDFNNLYNSKLYLFEVQ